MGVSDSVFVVVLMLFLKTTVLEEAMSKNIFISLMKTGISSGQQGTVCSNNLYNITQIR